MKQNNKYSRAIEKIRPEEGFVNDTLEKLEKGNKPGIVRYAAYAAAALAVIVAAALTLPALLNKNAPAKNNPETRQEEMTASKGDISTDRPGSDSAATPRPTSTATPWIASTATLTPNYTSMPTPDPISGMKAYTEEAGAVYEDMDVEDGLWAMEGYAFTGFPFDTEEYSHISENGFKLTRLSALSTFAADVDTAGYSTLRRKLLDERFPDEDSVRIEEMLNYFRYTGLAPEDGAPAAISACLGACPWNEDAALLFVGIGAQKIDTENLPRSNLVFLIDTSGSMDGSDRLDLAKRAFHLLSDTLREGDTVSIVTYSGSFRVLLEGVDASNRAEILRAVDSLEAYGSTNGGDAIVTAYAIAEKYFVEGGNNRVIMMTDGDLNVGITSESELVNLIETKKQSGVFLSVLGFGMGNYKDNKLEALADHGNGVYSYIDGITEARKVLVTEMGANFYTVAKDVKIQIEFNPDYVQSYRQIGYENRQMAAEDFSDDSKNGGEMSSGHTVVALYELIPAEGKTIAGVTGKKASDEGPEYRYQQTQTNGIEEVCKISLRYKEPDGDESSLISLTVTPETPAEGADERNLKLASAIAEFGMVLRDSPYKGSATYDSASGILKSLSDLNDDETELLYLMTAAKRLER